MKALKRIRNIILVMLLLCAIAAAALLIYYRNDLKTLRSIKEVEKGVYTMTCDIDYKFDEFLKAGAKNDDELGKFISQNVLDGSSVKIMDLNMGCTCFVSRNEDGDVIFGRNFDFLYTPFVQVFTHPENGYASVSTVPLSSFGYSKDKLPAPGFSKDNRLMYAAPYMSCDGVNEKGVSAALLTVPVASDITDPGKVTINQTAAIRLILDKAANVGEAVELLGKYNIYFSQNLKSHILIADSSGDSVIVEYYDGGMQIIKSGKDYQIAANHIAYQDLNIFESPESLERQEAVEKAITEHDGKMDMKACEDILNTVGIYNKQYKVDTLQWSVVYDLTDRSGRIWPHRTSESAWDFTLDK